MRKFEDSIPLQLLKAREATMSFFRPILQEISLTEQQWRVLRVLAEFGPVDATEIAQQACLLMPSLTRILQGFEKRGFCTRYAHPSDKRRVLIEITDEGRALIDANIAHSNRIFAELEAAYGKERIEDLLDLLNDLSENTR